ncbi:hypothetical protein OIU76_015192 [Salix suchowensis]|nr:hypothetical protein OIU76_015192 [Salix suchowensis]
MRARSGETGTPLGNTSETTVPLCHSPRAVGPTSSSSRSNLISLEKPKSTPNSAPSLATLTLLHRVHACSARSRGASMHSLVVFVLPLKSMEAILRATLLGLVL